jgi:alkylhydroperoxidase family enzyme
MARVSYLTASDAPTSVAETLSKFPPMHVLGLMAHAQTAFRPWLEFIGSLLNDLELDPKLRELTIMRVGQLCARYEWEQHVAIALSVGITQEQIDALDREEFDGFDELSRAVLDFTTGVVEGNVGDDLYASVASYLPEREVVELTLVAGHYLMLARMMTTFRIESDPPVDHEAVFPRMRG